MATYCDDEKLAELYGELIKSVKAGDVEGVADFVLRLSVRIAILHEKGYSGDERLDDVLEALKTTTLEDVISIGTLGSPAVRTTRSPVVAVPGLSAADRGRKGAVSSDSKRDTPVKAGFVKKDEYGGVFRVWFGTNRKPNDAPLFGKGFSSDRAKTTFYGYADVFIPKSHKFGETGNNIFERITRFELRDDHLRVQNVSPMATDEFWLQVKEETKKAGIESKRNDSLVFVHGYNTSFTDAVIRAAQIGLDLRVPGATAVFCWPSQGKARAYIPDAAAMVASERSITRFLVDFVRRSGADVVHLIAHSMGNRGVLRALEQIATMAQRKGVRFGQIILAAPDEDRDFFLQLESCFPIVGEHATLYASKKDKAVQLSAILHRAPRAGFYTPYTISKKGHFDTIHVPGFNLDLMGHSYFAQAAPLLHDIYDMMNGYKPPLQRQRINQLVGAPVGCLAIT